MARRIRSASRWSSPTATCARSRPCCWISATRLGLPGMTRTDGSPRYPGGYPDYIVNHERAPGIGPLAGFRGAEWPRAGRGTPNPEQLQHYIDNGCHWYLRTARAHEVLSPCELGLSRLGRRSSASSASPSPSSTSSIASRCRSSASRRSGHGKVVPPEQHREAHRRPISIRSPSGIRPSRARWCRDGVPHACRHAAADGDVSFLGFAECLAPPDPRPQLALHGARDGREARASPMATG